MWLVSVPIGRGDCSVLFTRPMKSDIVGDSVMKSVLDHQNPLDAKRKTSHCASQRLVNHSE